jgi:hypothetical protein
MNHPSSTSKTVAFIYGFTEGKWHGKRFRRVLREHGYTVEEDPAAADIVIAHSAGAFYVPLLNDAQRLVLINPPYWPERALHTRARNMTLQLLRDVRPGNQPFYHTHKTAHNLTYLVRHARTNRAIIRRAYHFNLEDEIRHPNTILVRTDDDPWLTPELDGLKKFNRHLQIHRMPGGHDDCWLHPEAYLQFLD